MLNSFDTVLGYHLSKEAPEAKLDYDQKATFFQLVTFSFTNIL